MAIARYPLCFFLWEKQQRENEYTMVICVGYRTVRVHHNFGNAQSGAAVGQTIEACRIGRAGCDALLRRTMSFCVWQTHRILGVNFKNGDGKQCLSKKKFFFSMISKKKFFFLDWSRVECTATTEKKYCNGKSLCNSILYQR